MNQCEGLDQEIYDLYVLDLLESPLSQLVKTHLENGCPACQKGTGQGINLWTGMAISGALASGIQPNAALKRRIMKSVEPARPAWMEWLLMRETWAATAMFLVTVSGVSFWFYGRSSPTPTAVAPVQTAKSVPPPAPAPSPISETPQPTPFSPTAAPSKEEQAQMAALRESIARLERDLSASAASAGQSEVALRAERNRIQNLEAELGRQRVTLEAALQQRQQLEADYRRVQAQAAERAQPDRTTLQRVQFLEEENGRLRRDLNDLRKRADQGLQLASFLGSPEIRLVKLKGTEAANKASAQVLISGRGKILLFTGDLPPLPAGREYQLWMIRSSGPAIVSAGVFRSSDRQAEFQVADASLLNSLTSLSVTEEPAGGSAKPTGHKVLIGLARS